MRRKYGILAVIMVMTLLAITACGSDTPTDQVVLTRELYDELVSKANENEQLKMQVEGLQTEIDTLKQSMGMGETSDQGEVADTTTEQESGSSDSSAEEANNEEGYSQEAIAAMSLVPYEGDYGLLGYKNEDGEVIIEPKFEKAEAFDGDTALVAAGAKEGLLNRLGVVTWTKVGTYEATKFEPVNDLVSGSDFDTFYQEFLKALEDQDEAYIKAHTYENVKVSFGGMSGWEDLVSYWKMDQAEDTPFYVMMENTLKYGVVDVAGNGTSFQAPYVYASWPEAYDMFTYLACIGDGVNVRNIPTTEGSEVITQLSYDIVQMVEHLDSGWYKIILPNGDLGYVADWLLKSPLDYRVNFSKYDGVWKFDFFVKGD